MSTFLALLSSLASVVRWGEPWDVELDDDPLLSPAGEATSAW